ncbi:hypothetical protein [Cognatilysobacter segetis]|uniref:hypothetical protein n=1 Tax=Cognatilysobacter segetis TaxID=2492394 RepID=UPI00105B703F|nr:hypothetical protein [Lysobacter segetis]
MFKRIALVPLVFALALSGCGSDDQQTVAPDVPGKARRSDGAFPGLQKDPLGAVPYTVPANALTLGNALGPNGAVATPASTFTVNDTIHVTFPMTGRTPGAPVTVFWTYQDGRTHHEERGPLPAGTFGHYTFSKAEGMQPGRYNVEVQIANRPIGISDFVVQ